MRYDEVWPCTEEREEIFRGMYRMTPQEVAARLYATIGKPCPEGVKVITVGRCTAIGEGPTPLVVGGVMRWIGERNYLGWRVEQ